MKEGIIASSKHLPLAMAMSHRTDQYLTRLKQAVCSNFGITESELCGPSSKHALVAARKAFVFLAKGCEPITWHRIGHELNRDHSSIMRLYTIAESEAQAMPGMRKLLEQIHQEII